MVKHNGTVKCMKYKLARNALSICLLSQNGNRLVIMVNVLNKKYEFGQLQKS